VTVNALAGSATMPVPLFKDPFHPGCSPGDGEIESDSTREICAAYASPSGLLLYIPRSIGDRYVQFSARIRDLSRQASSAGTAIPVVRESEFRSEDFYLVNIPSDERFRANLRVYGGLERFTEDYRFIHPGGKLGLEIYDSDDLLAPLVTTTLELSEPETIEGSSLYVRPAFASIGDLTAAFPQLRNAAEYTIRVRPFQTIADPPREYSLYAFVTITNNESQEVTTVSP
jgi:hypothetical protein